MSRIEATIAALSLAEKAKNQIAYNKGVIAACHRKNIGELAPKFETDAEADFWRTGWDEAKSQLAG